MLKYVEPYIISSLCLDQTAIQEFRRRRLPRSRVGAIQGVRCGKILEVIHATISSLVQNKMKPTNPNADTYVEKHRCNT